MAFNPFSGFRKHQKYLMPSVLLLCMITFVLCSGVGSGDEWIWPTLRKTFYSSGDTVAEVNGRSVTTGQLRELEAQRNIANDYMREATKLLVAKIEQAQEQLKDSKDKKFKEQQEPRLKAIRAVLEEQLKRKYYFNTGTDLQELIDFVVWQERADKLGIRLVDEGVKQQLSWHLLGSILERDLAFGPNEALLAQRGVSRQGGEPATYDRILDALRAEFEVEIAKLSTYGARTLTLQGQVPFQFDMQTRLALTPDELWRQYQGELTEFDVTLLPVRAEDFLDQVKTPSDAALKELFEKHKKDRYDPTLDRPGFIAPEQIQLGWMTADPEDPRFTKLANVATTLEKYPPAFLDTGMPVLGTALRYAAAEPAWDTSMQLNYESRKQNFNTALKYLTVPLTDPHFTLPLYTRVQEPTPAMAAGLVAAAVQAGPALLVGPFNFQAAAVVDGGEAVEKAIDIEARRRVPAAAGLVLAAAAPARVAPLLSLGQWAALEGEPQFLPYPVVEPELRGIRENQMAQGWVKDVMTEARDFLGRVRGEAGEIEARVEVLKEKYPGLQVHITEPRSQYDIAQDPAVKGFKEAYDEWHGQINYYEGRLGTERELKDTDFPKLFFDATERFSVSNAATYVPHEWPPTVTLPARALMTPDLEIPGLGEDNKEGQQLSMWSLFAEKPILFWKTAHRRATPPQSFEAVKDKVLDAYKLQEARKLAFEKAKEVTKALSDAQIAEQDYHATLAKAASELGVEPVTLNRVAPKVRINRGQFGTEYAPFELPRGLIPHAREDMAKGVLALNDLQKPLTTVDPLEPDRPGTDRELDKLNKELFRKELVGTDKKQVQVLTNLPRTAYYVGAVTGAYPATMMDFSMAYQMARGQQQFFDMFASLAREEEAKEFREAIRQQLRSDAGYKAVNLDAYKQ